MKNSKDYSPKIDKLFKTLKKSADPAAPAVFQEPVEAIVHAFVSAFTTEAGAAKTAKRLHEHFVDLNDLRVSRPEEILEIFGDTSEAAAASALAMTTTLNAIFEKYDKVSLHGLTEEGKRQARKDLDEIPGMTSFVSAYTFLTALGGHAIPLTNRMIEYLRSNELVHPDASPQEIESFLERHISAADAYAFYSLLRTEAEGGSRAADAKIAAKKTTKTSKTIKKTAPKKTTVKKKTPKK